MTEQSQQSEELSLLHQQWLQLPITRQLGKLLQQHSDKLVAEICSESKKSDEQTDKTLRKIAIQLDTVQTINKLIYVTEIFTAKSRA